MEATTADFAMPAATSPPTAPTEGSASAEAWVQMFAEGWRAPVDADHFADHFEPVTLRTCDRITLRDGLAVERVAHVDPIPLLAAVALTPRAWPRGLRQQLAARRRST